MGADDATASLIPQENQKSKEIKVFTRNLDNRGSQKAKTSMIRPLRYTANSLPWLHNRAWKKIVKNANVKCSKVKKKHIGIQLLAF